MKRFKWYIKCVLHIRPPLFSQGHQLRDDDEPEGYGNVWYIYDDIYINVTAPLKNNAYLGRCIYTGMCAYCL